MTNINFKLRNGEIKKINAEDGLTLAIGKDVMARIDERSDKGYATQVYYCMSIGATRMEEEKVVQIDCDESA